MDAIEAIRTRRSIRKFKDGGISEETIRLLLEAAMNAPSAGNEQPWQFVVIDDRKILDEIPGIHPHTAMLKQAPMAILVCGDLSLEKYKGFWVQDCSAAVQNLLLAAHALGLGAVWTGFHPMEDRVQGMRRLLGLPEHVIPLALVPLGHPDQPSGRQERFREDRIHRNGWGKRS
jgi:nitroreductase